MPPRRCGRSPSKGYANTSLRDIARNSEFSHGVLHYYFADKSELITYCVRKYKAECGRRYAAIVATAATAEELRAGVGAAMTATLRDDFLMHRLWYDLRNQSLFDETFRGDVLELDESLERMIWRIARGKPMPRAGRPGHWSDGEG